MSGSACRYLIFLLWSSIVLIAGLFLFTGGFLLRRTVLPDKSLCNNLTNPYPDSCNVVPKQFSKAIVIIIDALKYDFVVYNETLPLDQAKPYQNRLPILNNLHRHRGGRLYEFLADPPTTTMQRLKGLTTGSLPTFIDVSSNFASYEINEDNIIDQLVRAQKRVVFAGDDTWMGLFPGRFSRSYPYPSFDVWDLDTVDNGVTKHLYQELEEPSNWEVFIGHYLGVDHAGHKYGPNHSEMTRKLREMNDVISHVTSKMPDDCVLFVMGDHGMTMSGDHGGDSADELSAALFIYSKQMNHTNSWRKMTINQVDFVPTFSLLLGLPIPFSNLGKVIHDVVVSAAVKQVQYIKVNVEQVYKYLEAYTAHSATAGGSPLPKTKFADIREMTQQFRSKKSTVMKSSDVETMLMMGSDLLKSAKSMCQSAFIEFNLNLIAFGLTVIFLHVCLLLVLVLTPRKSFLRNIINFRFLANLFLSSIFGMGLGSLVSLAYASDNHDLIGMAVVMASTGCSLMMFGFTLLWRLRNSLSEVFGSMSMDLNTVFHYGLSLVLCFGLLSNSFVVEEAQIHTFAVTTLLLAHCVLTAGGRRKSVLAVTLLAMGLVRVSSVYFRCREEQNCLQTDFHKPIGNLAQDVSHAYKNWRFFFTILSVVLTVCLPHCWLRHCGNLNGLSIPVALAIYVPPAAGVCLVFHWALQGLPQEIATTLLPWQHNILAHFVFALCFGVMAVVVAHPKLLYLVNTQQQRNQIYKMGHGVKTYYNILKSNWQQHLAVGGPSEKKILVYGIGTGVSAAFVLIATMFALVSMLILGDGLCPSMSLMFVITFLFLFVSSQARIAGVLDGATFLTTRLCHVPWSAIIGWHLLEELYFYATGHQPTFPSIQWNAAFVGGLSGSDYGSSDSNLVSGYLVPIVLIGWNTYVSRLWFGLMLPLLLAAPFAIWMALPSVRPTADEKNEELGKGEVCLLENKEEARSQLFSLCVKYCVLQCLKMFASMLAAALLRRHLMVWKIFAPRFIFEGVGFIVSLASVQIGYILFARIQNFLCSYYNGVNVQGKED